MQISLIGMPHPGIPVTPFGKTPTKTSRERHMEEELSCPINRHGLVLGMQTTSCIPSSSANWDAFLGYWDASNIIFFMVGMHDYFNNICIPVVSARWDANQYRWDAASGHPSAMPCLLSGTLSATLFVTLAVKLSVFLFVTMSVALHVSASQSTAL